MSIYGYSTKRDLTKLGSFLIMGLIGIIIASVVNMFMKSPMMYFVISIIGVFGFGRFAKECEMIEEKPIIFAGVKEYYFAGGWPDPTYITMFDVEGNKLGISPDWEYAEQFCKFY